MKKKFDAVQMVREIRDSLYKETRRMSSAQRIDFYRRKAKEFYDELGIKEPEVSGKLPDELGRKRSLTKAH